MRPIKKQDCNTTEVPTVENVELSLTKELAMDSFVPMPREIATPHGSRGGGVFAATAMHADLLELCNTREGRKGYQRLESRDRPVLGLGNELGFRESMR